MIIEKIFLDYLNENLGFPAYTEKPTKSVGKYVVIEKTNGGIENYVQNAVIAVQSYGDTLWDAAQLNMLVQTTVADMIELPEISHIKLNSDYNFTNTATKEYRYQAIFDIVFFD